MSVWSDVRTAIRTELQEDTPGFWSQVELLRWANRFYSELTKACKVEATSALVLASGTESYAVPADFYLARRIEIQSTVGSNDWFEVQPYNLNIRYAGDPVNASTGVPHGYYVFGNTIKFVPIPDGAYSGTLYYFRNSTPLVADGDALVYPEGVLAADFDDAILLGTCARALRKRQDGSFTTYMNDYNAALGAMAGDATERGQATPLLISDDWASE